MSWRSRPARDSTMPPIPSFSPPLIGTWGPRPAPSRRQNARDGSPRPHETEPTAAATPARRVPPPPTLDLHHPGKQVREKSPNPRQPTTARQEWLWNALTIKLKERRDERGNPSNKLHSWLTIDHGIPEALVHLGTVVGVMKLHKDNDYDTFVKQLDTIAPVYPEHPGLFDDPNDWKER